LRAVVSLFCGRVTAAIQAKLASLTFIWFSLNECWRRPRPPLGKKKEHRVLLNSRPCCRECRQHSYILCYYTGLRAYTDQFAWRIWLLNVALA